MVGGQEKVKLKSWVVLMTIFYTSKIRYFLVLKFNVLKYLLVHINKFDIPSVYLSVPSAQDNVFKGVDDL